MEENLPRHDAEPTAPRLRQRPPWSDEQWRRFRVVALQSLAIFACLYFGFVLLEWQQYRPFPHPYWIKHQLEALYDAYPQFVARNQRPPASLRELCEQESVAISEEMFYFELTADHSPRFLFLGYDQRLGGVGTDQDMGIDMEQRRVPLSYFLTTQNFFNVQWFIGPLLIVTLLIAATLTWRAKKSFLSLEGVAHLAMQITIVIFLGMAILEMHRIPSGH